MGSAVAALDHALTSRYIPVVAFSQPGLAALVSNRLGCVHFSPPYAALDLAELCTQ